MPRPIRFNAFSMNAASHQSPGLWRHPRNTSVAFNRLSYWTDLARLLERGLFDALFIADVLGIYDVYQGGPEERVVSRLPGSKDPVRLRRAV